MTESQSRYSIVERLTQKKLDIISEKLELDEELKIKEQEVEQLKKDLIDWEKDIQKDNERIKRLKQRAIEKAEILSNNAKQIKAAKEKSFDEKIKAIELALERIEEISKTSPTIQSS
jgi:phage-related minor tail protein